ncbi:MAG: biotin--[acetyl-CoA-carboxylase] ligase [Syntrophales bacterium]|nr:biotin--[acetyl-CoA-carboxylase] ligase [Syntrophales bacterium]
MTPKGTQGPRGPKDGETVSATILGALKESPAPLSGEALAGILGLSRAAVWKRINRLKALGYDIEGSPRRGYRLLGVPDKLLPAEILQGLNTRYLKGPIHHFDSLPSTNDLAKELGSQDAPEGSLVVAESQTKGRGRLGREWDSPPGTGLYVSLLLRPPLPPTEMPQITLTTAVAVVRALKRAAGVAPGIKWPNDLLLDGKKLGGILTEMETESGQIRHLVVGLGLNVNNREFPPPLNRTATSLVLATGSSFCRRDILRAWLEEFEALYDFFLNQDFGVILDEWREYNVTLGQTVTVRQGPREISGLALEVATDGALLLRQRTGEVVRVTSGEIVPGP